MSKEIQFNNRSSSENFISNTTIPEAAALNQQKTNKKSKFEFSDRAREAFHKIKNILTTNLILGLPDDSLPFKLQTDACVDGIGAVLLQVTLDGDRPLAFMSKKLTKSKTN
ncbi:unnamed protein product [Rotaria magnacalcarata]|uniref:Reverse transcriptase/retrotransposon-derived protein RNase H-like domain-containing protein n=1 Tax=Rotaria magnacalcarata TaxID=392030 RepID=A0A820IQ95_9BILA|nr:unnamed protein product [Rotaria magnacalcarata]